MNFQTLVADTDQVSSDLDSMPLLSLFGNPNLSLVIYSIYMFLK